MASQMKTDHKVMIGGVVVIVALAYIYKDRLASMWKCMSTNASEHFEVLAPINYGNASTVSPNDATTTQSNDTLVAYQPGVSAESWANTFAPLDQAEAEQSMAWIQAQQNVPQPELLPDVAPEYAALLSNQNFLQAGSAANGGIFTRPVFRNDSGSYSDFFRQQILPTTDANAMAGTQLPVGEPIIRGHQQL